tara:strand:+ start:402 stop:1124 length:723 start_codon:yes stop_codon:yes gene_type:complete
MAITAAISLSSAAGDLVSNALTISTSTALTKAGVSTALAETSGLAKKTITGGLAYTLFEADDYTGNLAHKLYLKNTETTAALYWTISNGDEVLGRLYAQDWALIPWAAVNGTKQAFTCTLAGTYATGDTILFDGVTTTLGATQTPAGMVDLVKAESYPNWTVVETSASVLTFTAKKSNNLANVLLGDMAAVTTGSLVATTAGNGTATNAQTIEGSASANDLKITPSTTAAHTMEYMLFHE